ncbi:hypothetical protein D9758_000541 [Tetrapyrgos nigripes]|uniref:WLM-domain-containing protein n=1 Tax=Tetrapyrgos nigripes TaxID=182062 RepID=A0A8H5H1I3_9AGAR|nr:hypothetical protein D9758_000541 [Tetrapyrgos nigripes]
MVTSEDGPLSSQSLFLFVRPRDSTKSHYRPYSTVSTLETLAPPSSTRESTFLAPERPMSMMGFKKSSKLKAGDEKSSSNGTKSGGISLFSKTMKKKRSLNGLRLLNNATEIPSPLSSPSLLPSPSDLYSSDSSTTLLNNSSNDASSSSSSSPPSSKTPSEEHLLMASPRKVDHDSDAVSGVGKDKFDREMGFAEQMKMKIHRYGNEVPYMLAFDAVVQDNDKYFNMLLRRLNSSSSPTFYDYAKHGDSPPSAVLDLGCGAGHWMLDAALHWRQARIVGIDITDLLLPEVRERENIKYMRSNFVLRPLPFPANTFDLVRMSNLSSSIPCDRWEFVFSEVFRVLRYDGRLEFIDDQRCFPYFNAVSKQVEYHEENSSVPSAISDRVSGEAPSEVDPDLAKEEDYFPTQNEVDKSIAPSFWDGEEGSQNGIDDDAETPSLSTHPYSFDTSYADSSSSSSLDSHEVEALLDLNSAIPFEIKFETDVDTAEEEYLQNIEVKSNRFSYRPLPVPNVTPSRPLPRPPSILSLDTTSDTLSIASTKMEDSPDSAREAKALKLALRASVDERVDAFLTSFNYTEFSDASNISSLSITIPSSSSEHLLPSPLPDSPTEPSFQPSPVAPDTSSTLETPIAALPDKATSTPVAQSPIESSPMPAEWLSKSSASKDLENVFNSMMAELGFFTDSYRHVPNVMKHVFGENHATMTADMRLMLAPEDMDDGVQSAQYMRGRSWTGGDKKSRNDWEKKERGKKETNSRPISPIIESRSSSESTSSTPTPTPSKAIPEGISAKAAGRLGIALTTPSRPSTSSGSKVGIESRTPSRPSTSSSGSSGSSTLFSTGRPSCDSEEADRSQGTCAEPESDCKPRQSPGLVLWPSIFIPIGPTELEMHVCKGMQELLGSKVALWRYIQDLRDADGKPFLSEEEFEDAIWEYECFRRERLNWPYENTELNLEPHSPDVPSFDDNIDLPYTYETSRSITEASKPRNTVIDAAEFSDDKHRIASLVKPIMRKHGWVLPALAEFFPDNPNLLGHGLGLNVNMGQKILVRLRPAHYPDWFMEEEDVVQTMLHELTHNVHGPHDDKFYKFLSDLQEEYDALRRSGYAGEGFFSKGQRLGTNVSHNLPPHLARAKALEAAEKRRQISKTLGEGGRRLGGRLDTSGKALSPRELAARAAERRVLDEKMCGQGDVAKREAEKAAKESVENKVIDLTLDDSDDEAVVFVERGSSSRTPQVPARTKASTDAAPVSNGKIRSHPLQTINAANTPPTVNYSTKPALPIRSHTNRAEWECPACTLLNSSMKLQCEACLTTRPLQVSDGWTCLTCGESGMSHGFWSCSFCGSIKSSSRS